MTGKLVVLSGGLDSATCLGMANEYIDENWEDIHAVTFRYGQLHGREVECARDIAKHYGVVWELLNLPTIGGSALTGEGEIRKDGVGVDIPQSYVPGRNTIFIALALSIAEQHNLDEVWVGVNAIDFSNYPDCRPEYIAKWNELARLSSKRAVEGRPIRIVAPLLCMSKREIIAEGLRLKVPYEKTWSCYQGGEHPCRVCDSCRLRIIGFKENGVVDPLL